MFIFQILLTAAWILFGLLFAMLAGAVVYFIAFIGVIKIIWKSGKKRPDLQRVFTYRREGE